MLPSSDQVRLHAYYRWEKRGYGHGAHFDDWVVSEQALLFSLNYEVLARHALDGPVAYRLGRSRPRICRFCEQAEPRTRFSEPVPVLPGSALVALDQCEECRLQFLDDLDAALGAFLSGTTRGVVPDSVPVAAYKGLVKTALSILPRDDLDLFPDAVEWVCNPDHDLDGGPFSRMGMGLFLHQGAALSESFVALARKTDDDEPMPSALFFLGGPGYSVSMALPLCMRDEELEGADLVVPRLATVEEMDASFHAGPVQTRFLPVQSAPARRRLLAAWAN